MGFNGSLKISRFQLFSIFLMGRAFSECLNVPNEVSFYGMQRFSVIFLSRLFLLIFCIPLIILIKKYPEETFFSIIAKKSKVAGWIIFAFLTAHIGFLGVFLSVKYELYVQNTVMSTASSSVLVIIFFAAVIYGTVKGLQAAMRAGSALLIIFGVFLIITGIALYPRMNLNFLYPAFVDRPETFLYDVFSETVKNTEIYILLLLSRYTSKSSGNLMFLLTLFSLLIVEYMHFTYVTVLGPYLDNVSFPFYTNASLADIVLIDRLDGLDMIIWTITSVLEVTIMIMSVQSMLADLVKQKLAEKLCVVFAVIIGVFTFFGTLDRSTVVNIYSPAYMGITLIIFVVIMPVIALLLNKKNKRRKGITQDELEELKKAAVPAN